MRVSDAHDSLTRIEGVCSINMPLYESLANDRSSTAVGKNSAIALRYRPLKFAAGP